MTRHRTHRPDANQQDCVDALRACGWRVEVLSQVGKNVPDLLVGAAGFNLLIEVKGEGGKLSEGQRGWHATWTGQRCVARSPEECIKAVQDYLERMRGRVHE